MAIDLTPFGFTPTESAAYGRLLALGPSSGYAVAKDLGLARANAYAALDSLSGKGAALVEDTSPKLYRPVTPEALLVRIAARESAKLRLLEDQVSEESRAGAPTTTPLSGEREFADMALRTAARHAGPAVFLGPSSLLGALLPVWRKRQADGARTTLLPTDAVDPSFPIAVTATIDRGRVQQLFHDPVAILLTSDAGMAGTGDGASLTGFWSSERILVGLLRAAVDLLSGEPTTPIA